MLGLRGSGTNSKDEGRVPCVRLYIAEVNALMTAPCVAFRSLWAALLCKLLLLYELPFTCVSRTTALAALCLTEAVSLGGAKLRLQNMADISCCLRAANSANSAYMEAC